MEQQLPDWSSIAELTQPAYRLIAAREYYDTVQMLYNDVVCDPKLPNNSIVGKFKHMTERSSMLKMMWNVWIEGFTERSDGPVTHQEVLQFLMYLSMCEERQAVREASVS